MPPAAPADPKRLLATLKTLCLDIGERYSGTAKEQQAADFIAGQMSALGLANVHQQPFEFPNWDYQSCTLEVGGSPGSGSRGSRGGVSGGGAGRAWRSIDSASPMCYSPSTPAGGITGPLAYLQTGSPLDFDQPLTGKIGLLIGSLSLGDPQVKQRIVNAGMRALLVVDPRSPYGWPIYLGAAPQWMDGYHLPTVGLPFLEAQRQVCQLPLQARVQVAARRFPAVSQNVIGEITGSTHREEVIVISAHHDTVLGITGADDNASGVAFVLELARLFSRRKPRRTLRFISYGVEEKLSIGAYVYMRSLSAAQQKRCVLVVNADTIAAAVGQDTVFVTGAPALEKAVARTWAARRHPASIASRVDPYSDHFPLNICGIPALWLTRPSIPPAGYWYLHSVHDNLDQISPAVLARTVDSSAQFIAQVADARKLPFAPTISPPVMRQVRSCARAAYSHPWPAATIQQMLAAKRVDQG